MTGNEIQLAFDTIVSRMQSSDSLNEEIGQILVSSAQKNFDAEGRYGELIDEVWQGGASTWKPLSDSRLKQRERKGHTGKKLQDTGGLKLAMSYEITSSGIEIGNGKDYAEYLQYGTSKMPARPFIMIQDEDIVEINHAVNDFFSRIYA